MNSIEFAALDMKAKISYTSFPSEQALNITESSVIG